MQASVDGDLPQIEADDPVVGREPLLDHRINDARRDPLVTSVPRRRVGDLVVTQPLGVFQRTARRQPHDDHRDAVAVGRSSPVHPERVRVDWERDQWLEGLPDGVSHFGVARP